MGHQIKSKNRVAEFGEVLTAEREVKAMLDLVKQETQRIESRFLEPACGTGNFLVEILNRKLNVVDSRYRRSQLEWERNAVLAVSSIYGIDILEDNVETCRSRLLDLVRERYERHFRRKVRPMCLASVSYVLERNIVWGDALSLHTIGMCPQPIVFSEWSPVNGSLIKQREFVFKELVEGKAAELGPSQPGLFGDEQDSLFRSRAESLVSDEGASVFIPDPIGERPLVHFLELGNAD